MQRTIETVDEQQITDIPPPPPPEVMTRIPPPTRNDVESDIIQVSLIQVSFMDGQFLVIPKEWYNKYPKMQEQPIMRTRADFLRIIPILNNFSCKNSMYDEHIELDELFDILNYFGIKLNDRQLVEIHMSAGLLDLINEAKMIIDNIGSKCFKRGLKKRLTFFKSNWDKYIGFLTQIYKDDNYKNIDFEHLINTLDTENTLYLLNLNVLYNNQIHVFLKYLKSVVKDRDQSIFTRFVDSIEQTIPNEGKELTTKILDVVGQYGNTILTSKIKTILDLAKAVPRVNNK